MIQESDSMPAEAPSPAIAAAQAVYDKLADLCRDFDPATIKLRRQWDQEIKDRLKARAADRLRLIALKGVAFKALAAAKAGQADLQRQLDAEMGDLEAARAKAVAEERERYDRIQTLQRHLELAGEAIAEPPPPAPADDEKVSAAEAPAADEPSETPADVASDSIPPAASGEPATPADAGPAADEPPAASPPADHEPEKKQPAPHKGKKR